jgi:hypothetical protein
MKYMILIYRNPALDAPYGSPEFDAMMAGYGALNAQLAADGVLVMGEALQGIETATSVRVRSDKVETMDGPFAETREHLGGIYIIDVPDLDAAIRYAAMVPTATSGTIELRPLMGYNPDTL